MRGVPLYSPSIEQHKALYLSQGGVDLGGAPLVPQADRVHEPEEVVPLRPRNGLLAQQFEDGRPHGRPLVLEGQLAFVLQHGGDTRGLGLDDHRAEGRPSRGEGS